MSEDKRKGDAMTEAEYEAEERAAILEYEAGFTKEHWVVRHIALAFPKNDLAAFADDFCH